MQELVAAVQALEAKAITVGDLPLKQLQDKLELFWQPDGSVLLQDHSVTATKLRDSYLPADSTGFVQSSWDGLHSPPSLTIPRSGRWVFQVIATGYNTAGGVSGGINYTINAVAVGRATMYFTSANTHLAMGWLHFNSVVLPAGSYTVTETLVGAVVTRDGNDTMQLYGWRIGDS